MEDLFNYIKSQYRRIEPYSRKDTSVPKFWEYYFKHKPMMSAFNDRYDFLKIPFFGRKIELRDNFKHRLNELFLNYIVPFRKYLKQIIESGWRWNYLSIKEYNVIVLFADFCGKFENVETVRNINAGAFFKMEEAFIKLAKNPEYQTLVMEVFYKIIEKTKDFNEAVRAKIDALGLFFKEGGLHPDMPYMLQTDNIYYYKRYFSLIDVFDMEFMEGVVSDFYDCPRDVFEEIVYNIESLLKQIKRYEVDKENITWLKNMSLVKNGEMPAKIINFYNGKGSFWAKDSDDFFKLFINLAKLLIDELDFILYKDFDVLDTDGKVIRVKIFDKSSFEVLFQKLNNEFYLAKARYFSVLSTKIGLVEFITNPKVTDDFSEVQKFVYEKVMSMLSLLSEISLKINKLLDTDGLAVKIADRNKYIVKLPADLKGKSLHQAVFYYLELFLQICGYFREPKIMQEIERLGTITKQLDDTRAELNRISDSNRYIESKLVETGRIVNG